MRALITSLFVLALSAGCADFAETEGCAPGQVFDDEGRCVQLAIPEGGLPEAAIPEGGIPEGGLGPLICGECPELRPICDFETMTCVACAEDADCEEGQTCAEGECL